MLPDPKTRLPEAKEAPSNGSLLAEITQKTVDLRDTLGARWGIPKKEAVQSFARSFISSKVDFGWEVVHQFMTVCSELDLNPARKEVAAFYDPNKGLTSFVMIDGWLTLANRHPDYDGYKLAENRTEKGELVSVRCEIFRKSRGHPTEATVKMSEWRVGGAPQWMSKPEWMLNIKALKQAIRLAFGFAGITDDDEAFAMYHEAPAKAEPKGTKIDDLKPTSAPPADEHDRKAPEAPKPTFTGPKPGLKLEDAQPAVYGTDNATPVEITHFEAHAGAQEPVKQETAPTEPPKPEVAQAKIEAAPPKQEPEAKPYAVTDPDFNTPVICGRKTVTGPGGKKSSEYWRRPPADMTPEELKYALAYNIKSLTMAKNPETLAKLKKIEQFLVEVAQAKGVKGEEIGMEVLEQPPAQPAPEPEKPAEPEPTEEPKGPTKEDAAAIGKWVKERRNAKKMALGTCAKLCDLTPAVLQAVENGTVDALAGVSDYSIEQLAQVLAEPDDTTRREVLLSQFGRA